MPNQGALRSPLSFVNLYQGGENMLKILGILVIIHLACAVITVIGSVLMMYFMSKWEASK